MYYYIISNYVFENEQLPNSSQYPDMIELNEQQIAFYHANPTASASEVIAMELNPIPEPPEPSEPLPTLEERVELLEQLELERYL